MNVIEKSNKSDIAVIGMACQFPEAPDYRAFWQNLRQGVHAIKTIPDSRWDTRMYYSPDTHERNKSISKWSGLIDGFDRFDHRFFNMTMAEAMHMEPQQRLLLEEAWHCIEDSGVSVERLRGTSTSVYIGTVTSHDYLVQATSPGITIENYSMTGNHQYMLANRISYFLDLKGPSVSVDAACASSLVAIHEARHSLLSGQCAYALAGGVWLSFDPWFYISLSKAGVISPDGRCKTFDENANGFVQGEGVGLLLLQRLDDALTDGNHVYGILRGSAVNHGGKGQSLTAPRVSAQKGVIDSAIQDAGIDPADIGYVEAHGTGTYLGDPIEIEGLTQTFRTYTPNKQYCFIGSVKANIGHLIAAAGVAGVIKILLMMKYKKIPPHINFTKINPLIPIESSPFVINDRLIPWDPNPQKTWIAGISSFGLGGTNAHMIIEAPDSRGKDVRPGIRGERRGRVFMLSAKTPEALEQLQASWKSVLAGNDPEFSCDRAVHDICSTLMTGRESFPYRFGFIVDDKQDLPASFFSTARENNAITKPFPWWFWAGTFDVRTLDFSAIDNLTRICGQHEIIANKYTDIVKLAGEKRLSAGLTSLMMESLIAMGVRPSCVSGFGEGLIASMVVADMVPIHDAIAFIKSEFTGTLDLKRPTIPFYNPVSRDIIRPYRVTGSYPACLVKERTFCPSSVDQYITKALSLTNNRPMYRKYLEKWMNLSPALDRFIHDLIHHRMPKRNSVPFFSDQLSMLVALVSSLRKVSIKWDIPEQKIIDDDALFELADLIDDQILSPNHVIDLIMNKDKMPALETAASLIDRNQHLLDPEKPYAVLKKECLELNEISDIRDWFSSSVKTYSPSVLGKEAGHIFLGQGPECPEGKAVIHPGHLTAPDDIVAEVLTHLWLNGVNINWQLWHPEGSFQKMPLPTYPFLGKPLWITDSVTKAGASYQSDSLMKFMKQKRFLEDSYGQSSAK